MPNDEWFDLRIDSDFEGFNFCPIHDPSLKPGGGPSLAALYKLAHEARLGDRSAVYELASATHWTLKETSFESFQRTHGARPIRYREWFYSKLRQFIAVLVHEYVEVYGPRSGSGIRRLGKDECWTENTGMIGAIGPLVKLADLEAAFGPEDCENFDWFELVEELSAAGEEQRLVRWAALVESRKLKHGAGVGMKTGRRQPRCAERDGIIVSCLERSIDRREICRILDQKGIPTTAGMQRSEVYTWVTAWDDPEFRNNVQQVFSKVVFKNLVKA